MKRNAIIGGAVWCCALIAAQLNIFDLTWIELLFLFAPLVIVPLSIYLTREIEAPAPISRFERLAQQIQLPAALFATASCFHGPGILAAILAAPLLARSAFRSVRQFPVPLWASALFHAVAVGVLAGPCVLAMGFVFGQRVKLAAALVLVAGEIGLAILFVLALNRVDRFAAQLVLTVAAASVAFSMALAAVWAIGEYPLQPFVNLDQMERLHGTANALGFTLCGLLGWILAGERKATDEAPLQ